jgi:hypothetical protein
MKLLRALAILTFLLAVAASAQARPIVVGAGGGPGVAIDSAGTAHIAYNADLSGSSDGQPLMYCAWPRGARRCTPRPIIADGESPFAQPALVRAGPAPGEVTIVSPRGIRSQTITAITSLDGGATFGAPRELGTGRWFDGAFGPGGQLALSFPSLGFVEYYHRSLAGSPSTGSADLGRGYTTLSEVGFARGRPVLVSGARNPGIGVSSWTGQGDVHDVATWAGPFKVAESNAYSLAGGRRGLFLAHERPADTEGVLVVRRFRKQRFGRARRVPASRSDIDSVGLGQDPRGRLVAVWYEGTGDRLLASASRNGRRWTRPRVLARRLDPVDEIEVGLGRGGRGVAVWDQNFEETVPAVRVNARRMLRSLRRR